MTTWAPSRANATAAARPMLEFPPVTNATLPSNFPLNYAFNNAGIGVQASIVDLTEADFDRVIGINLKGVWLCMKAEIRQMLTQGGGAIVNRSSGYGLFGSSLGVSAYARSQQAWRHRADQGCGTGMCQSWHPGQCGRARVDPNPHGGRELAA